MLLVLVPVVCQGMYLCHCCNLLWWVGMSKKVGVERGTYCHPCCCCYGGDAGGGAGWWCVRVGMSEKWGGRGRGVPVHHFPPHCCPLHHHPIILVVVVVVAAVLSLVVVLVFLGVVSCRKLISTGMVFIFMKESFPVCSGFVL